MVAIWIEVAHSGTAFSMEARRFPSSAVAAHGAEGAPSEPLASPQELEYRSPSAASVSSTVLAPASDSADDGQKPSCPGSYDLKQDLERRNLVSKSFHTWRLLTFQRPQRIARKSLLQSHRECPTTRLGR